MQTVAEEYKKLSPSEKAVWEQKARDDKNRYNKERTDNQGTWNLPKRRAKKHPLAPKRP